MKEHTPSATAGGPSFCPSCDRFIGAADSCPYCDTDSSRPAILTHLRTVALLTALVGLALLLAAARAHETPAVAIADISPSVNHARARISGTVLREPYVDSENTPPVYISFSVGDGSNQLRVVSEGRTASELVEQDLLPRKGDVVEVRGTINVQPEGRTKLRLTRAADLYVAKASPPVNPGRKTPTDQRNIRKNRKPAAGSPQ